jgi:hypothetical protein
MLTTLYRMHHYYYAATGKIYNEIMSYAIITPRARMHSRGKVIGLSVCLSSVCTKIVRSRDLGI